jgi:hypothetical protein
MLDAPAYLLSAAALLASLCALGLGAARVRSRLLAGWSGLPARLADAVLVIAMLILIAESIGTVGLLQRLPLTVVCVGLGLGLRFAVPAPSGAGQAFPEPDQGGWARRVAIAIAAILIVHWSIGTIATLGEGITNYDSTWYHMPFAAHFAQTGSSLGFAHVSPRYLAWFYPQNSELLHGIGMVFYQRDVLSPLLNLLWLCGCLVAAWCIGRPYGKGAWTLAAAAVVLDAGVMSDQAGQARNDVLGIFFLLAAAAMLVNGAAADRERGPGLGSLALAGICAGLAAGTKLSFVAPAIALLIGVPLLLGARNRLRATLAFGSPLLACCAFWYVRNVAVAGNPLPWFRAIGPLRLDGPEQGLGGRPQFSVLHYIGDGKVWSNWFEPALSQRLGELWPLVLLLAAAAIAICLVRGRVDLKLLAFAATAGVIAYLLDGTSAEGQPGSPDGFESSLRHLAPALILGLALVPLAPVASSRRGRLGLGALLAALLIAGDRSGKHWHSPYLLIADLAVVAALCIPLLSSLELPRLGPHIRRLKSQLRPLTVAAATIAAILFGGWFLQRSYLSHRYDEGGFRSEGLNAVFKWTSGLHDQRIATTVPIQYPLIGRDLSNRVSFVGRHRNDAGFTQIGGCRRLRAALAAGRYRFVLTAGGLEGWEPGKSHCLAADPRARPVIHVNQIVVFRLRRGAPIVGGRRREVRGGPARIRSSETRSRFRERQRSSRF